jgi:hypothetical protein
LNINGSVTTGTLNVDFIGTDGSVTDQDPLNAATCTLDYGDDVVIVTIDNGYPGYQCNPLITVKNTGTVSATATLDFPALEPATHVYVGGVSLGAVSLVPGAQTSFTLPIEFFTDPPMGTTVSFSFPIPVVQQ